LRERPLSSAALTELPLAVRKCAPEPQNHIAKLWWQLRSESMEATCEWEITIIEGSLEVKLPTIWTDEKQSREEAERRERLEERRVEEKKSKKKEDADA